MFDEAAVTVELVSGHLTVTQPREIAMNAAVFSELAEPAVYGKPARALITAALARRIRSLVTRVRSATGR
ncbi:hypothetical protein ACIBHX_20750 [Nonomuraea sp. NPDC050536]|uniref:hypothetical protein n=1 Tax=Nonomuraea sp. NPDC050536 TaxID=3364366 RepID=UPI0037CBAA23